MISLFDERDIYYKNIRIAIHYINTLTNHNFGVIVTKYYFDDVVKYSKLYFDIDPSDFENDLVEQKLEIIK